MDKILEAMMLSHHPTSMKHVLVKRIKEAAKEPLDHKQCMAMFELSTKCILSGNIQVQKDVGKEVLEAFAQNHTADFEVFFNVKFILKLLQDGYGTMSKGSSDILEYIQLGLKYIQGNTSVEAFHALQIELLRIVCEKPGSKLCACICKLLAEYPQCIPSGKFQVVFCQQLVRCIGQFQCASQDEDEIVEFLEQVNKVSGLLQRIWWTQTAAIIPSLRELFTVISSTVGSDGPSNALATVVHYVPLEIMDEVIQNLTNDDCITDVEMKTALTNMSDWISWPLAKNADKWIIGLLKGLAAVKKFSILIEVTLSKIEQVFSRLFYPIVRPTALSVLKYMLLSFQHSPEAFHLLVPQIPKLMVSLSKERSNSGISCQQQLSELVHCMIFRFSGFPDLYEPVIEALKRPAISPSSFLKASSPPWFNQGAQQDCSEYLRYLLDRLHEEEKTSKRITHGQKHSCSETRMDCGDPGKTLIERMFGGKMVTRILCRCCCNVSFREEAFTDLSLAFPPPNKVLQRCDHSVKTTGADNVASQVKQKDMTAKFPNKQTQTKYGEPSLRVVPFEIIGSHGKTKDRPSLTGVTKSDYFCSFNSMPKNDFAVDCVEKASCSSRCKSVSDLINYFLSPEMLSGDNRYYCNKCTSLQEAEKVVELTGNPHYLILTLLRFSFDLITMKRQKILENVSVPLVLKLPIRVNSKDESKIRAKNQRCKLGSWQPFAEDTTYLSIIYDLCSIVVHSGISSESGHYYCYASEYVDANSVIGPNEILNVEGGADEQWYLYNDTRVSFSSFESISNVTNYFPKDTAYVLFYRQRLARQPCPDGELVSADMGLYGEVGLNNELMEAISRDNLQYLQEEEKEARYRTESTTPVTAPSWWRHFDDDENGGS
ncbi:ubiquitin carboxyl-terminal hydrolase 35-like isoform X1 [Rhinoraja longicauda]